jgi:hypothetical protein
MLHSAAAVSGVSIDRRLPPLRIWKHETNMLICVVLIVFYMDFFDLFLFIFYMD